MGRRGVIFIKWHKKPRTDALSSNLVVKLTDMAKISCFAMSSLVFALSKVHSVILTLDDLLCRSTAAK